MAMQQAALFTDADFEEPVKTRADQIRARFEKFHAANPQVWELFKKFTLQLIAVGHQHYSSDAIVQQIRWHSAILLEVREVQPKPHWRVCPQGWLGGLHQPRGRRSCPGLQRLPGSRRNERRIDMDRKFEVGDELAVGNRFNPYVIRKISKISPTGRLTMSNGDVLNADLTIRGYIPVCGPECYSEVTDEIRESMRRHDLLQKVSRFNANAMTTDQLFRVAQIMDEPK